MNAQSIVFKVGGSARPAGGWPEGVFGVQGTVEPIESGYYDTDLRKINGKWKITRHDVLLDMPISLPGSWKRRPPTKHRPWNPTGKGEKRKRSCTAGLGT